MKRFQTLCHEIDSMKSWWCFTSPITTPCDQENIHCITNAIKSNCWLIISKVCSRTWFYLRHLCPLMSRWFPSKVKCYLSKKTLKSGDIKSGPGLEFLATFTILKFGLRSKGPPLGPTPLEDSQILWDQRSINSSLITIFHTQYCWYAWKKPRKFGH